MNHSYKDFFKSARQAQNINPTKNITAKKSNTTKRISKLGSKKKSRLDKFIFVVVMFCIIGIAGTLYLVCYPDSFDNFSLDIDLFGTAKAIQSVQSDDKAVTTTKSTLTPSQSQSQSVQPSSTATSLTGTSSASQLPIQQQSPQQNDLKPNDSKPSDIRQWTNEELSFLTKLEERHRELNQREQEIKRAEAELQKQQSLLSEKIKKVDKMRSDIAILLKERMEMDEKRVNKLVEFYSDMKPQNAAKIIETLDEDLSVEIFGKMKKKTAADIMNLLLPEKAQRLSEKYAGYFKKK